MIIYINGRGMNAPELKAYISELEAENAELRAKVESAERQKAEYKQLLKAAVPIINNTFPETGSCWGCANHDEVKDECQGGAFAECSEVCKWEHADEALALIGEGGDTE